VARSINVVRLLILLSIIWVISWTAYCWSDIAEGLAASERERWSAMQQTQAIRYDECLADNGTSWSELVAKHGESCKKSEPDVCGAGTQNYYFCPDGYNQELYKSCLRSIVEPCLSIYFLVSENQLPRGWLDRTKMRWERIAFYWGDWGSQPFKKWLVFLVAIPFGLSALPMLLRWLTDRN